MRILNIAVIAATLIIPSIGHSQDSGRVGGPIGPNLETTGPAHPAGSQQELQPWTMGAPPGAQPFAGYPGTAGGRAPANVATMAAPGPSPGGQVSAIVNGHTVIFDPTTRIITRVIN
jgi:hypothetical protein